MSGTFEKIDVPPTLVSFAVSTANAKQIVSTEFKKAGSKVVLLMPRYDEYGLPVFESVRSVFDQVEALIADGKVAAAWTLGFGGVAEGIAKMAFGNGIGFRFQQKLSAQKLFAPCYGGFLLELTDDAATDDLMVIGQTTEENTIVTSNYTLQLDDLLQVWERKLEPVFPCQIKGKVTVPPTYFYERKEIKTSSIKLHIHVF